ncbi:MAG: membrane protein insertase YidC [Desulfobacteraceae bacterium]|nr:MAG: membrane protein insertase YidC [Desulfobacteraceae bacterium]
MEQSRLFIAIALSFLIFLLWHVLFVKEEPVPTRPPAQEVGGSPNVSQAPETAPKSILPAAPPQADREPAKASRDARIFTVDTPLYRVRISEKGAVFQSFVLKNYRESVGDDSALKELVAQEAPQGDLQFSFPGADLPDFSEAVFSSERSLDRLEITDAPQKLSFRWSSPEGIVLEKTFLFSPDTYLIDYAVTVKNGTDRSLPDKVALSLLDTVPQEKAKFGFEGASLLIGKKVEQVDFGDIPEKNLFTGEIKWVALQDRYFLTTILPDSVKEAAVQLKLGPQNLLEAQYVLSAAGISPGAEKRFDFALYFGPKSVQTLKEIGRDLDKAVDFGMFDILAKPCLWLMNFLYRFIPNYGVAIIILTILMKLLLWPLGTKSYKSMNEMKKLQPIMAQIREKYKGDKKRMNEEVMGLYRTYKINPMGGCLPMIAQIPVFFALYRMLYEAIELRHAPFFGWINDLSAPDRLFHFNFSIPFMEPPYGIPVLTLVMGGTMFLQQKMTPAPGDPSQAKMMMLMPVVFTFIFINFSSGLVLYWLINNVLSISQQYYITKKLS